MIIDSHTHIGRNLSGYSSHSVEGDINVTHGDLCASMGDAGIDQSVVFPLPVHSDLLPVVNQYILGGRRDALIPFAMIDPRVEFGAITRTDGYRGYKLHPLAHGYCVDHPVAAGIFQLAAAMMYPVIIHSGWGEHGRMKYIENVAREWPDVDIIVAHMVEPDCLDVVGRNSNMYIDTSYAPHPRRIELAVHMCGADHVLFGSDYPYGNQKFEMSKVVEADITPIERDMILGGNIRRLLSRE